MKKRISALAAACLLFAFANTASAHVTVWPKEANTGAYEKYTVRVPVEKASNTTKVRVELPTGVKVSTVQPMTGWTFEFEKDDEGYNKAIVWTATAGGIKQHEFMEFSFIGANPKNAGTLTWKSSQTYADGSVVNWSGAPGSQTPAAVTSIKQGTAGDDSHGHGDDSHSHDEDTAQPEPAQQQEQPQEQEQASAEAGTEGTSNTMPLILSGAALLVALISLFRKLP